MKPGKDFEISITVFLRFRWKKNFLAACSPLGKTGWNKFFLIESSSGPAVRLLVSISVCDWVVVAKTPGFESSERGMSSRLL